MRKLKRFIAACFAMNGIISNEELLGKIGKNRNSSETECEISRLAYAISDELLKQENQ